MSLIFGGIFPTLLKFTRCYIGSLQQNSAIFLSWMKVIELMDTPLN